MFIANGSTKKTRMIDFYDKKEKLFNGDKRKYEKCNIKDNYSLPTI